MSKVILILFVLNRLKFQCSKGCLMCADKSPTDKTKVCYLCDTNSNYYLKPELSCALSDLSNCIDLGQDNNCLKCTNNYYVDSQTKKCVLVSNAKKITNCISYDSNQNCQQCAKNYFKENNTCSLVTTPIQNCSFYFSQTECGECDNNFYPSGDKKSCLKLPQDCLSYSMIQCKSCSQGFIQNFNYYKKSLYKWSTIEERNSFDQLLLAQKNNQPFFTNNNFCEPVQATHCETFFNYNLCSSCIDGYYLDSSTSICTPYPQSIISNCKIYAFDDVQNSNKKYQCVSCDKNFYLKDKKTCLPIIQQPNCEEYNPSSITTLCIKCKNEFLLINGECKTERILIDHCINYIPDVNKCSICEANYTLNTDGTSCKQITPNCLVPISFDINSEEKIPCLKCQDEYYLENGSCLKGNLNCKEYVNETTCASCMNQFYSIPNCLNKHETITSCLIYSSTDINRCLVCESMKVPIYYNQKCILFKQIENCQTHDEQDKNSIKCNQCKEGFILSEDKLSCVQIPLSENCLYKLNGNCIKCKEGYFLVQVNSIFSCIVIPQYISTNCSSNIQQLNMNVVDISGSMNCSVCDSGFIGMNTFYCLEKQNIQFITSNTITENCVHIDSNGQCLKCVENYFLNEQDHTCSETCNQTIFWISGTMINICSELPGTMIAFKNENNENISLMCQSTHLSILSDQITNLNFWKTTTNGTNQEYNDIVYNNADRFYSVNCLSLSTYTLDGTLMDSIPTQNISNERIIRQQIQQDTFVTISCGWLKKGILKKNNETDYVDCLNTNQTKYLPDRLSGVPVGWSLLFNVHKCSNSDTTNNIPIIVTKISDGNFNGISDHQFTLNGDPEKPFIFCLDISSIDSIKIGLDISQQDDSRISKMKNCGLGVIDLTQFDPINFDNSGYDYEYADNYTQDHMGCIACKPGYKSSSNITNYVRQCVVIENCDNTVNQQIFNGCSKCKLGFTWATFDGSIDYSTCVKIPGNDFQSLSNCIGYFSVGWDPEDTKGRCVVCDIGYQLTPDGYCEQITISNCDEKYYFEPTITDYFTKNYLLQKGIGCSCGENNILMNNKVRQCVQLPSLSTNTTKDYSQIIVINDTQIRDINNLIEKCEKYNINNTCAQCITEYIITLDGLKCVSNLIIKGLEKCILLENDGINCKNCEKLPGFGLVDGLCEYGLIDGCELYNWELLQQQVVCTQCQDTYYQLNSTTCKKGKIPFCLRYTDQENNCSQCEDGYWLLKDTNSSIASYCIPKEPLTKCKSATFTKEYDNSAGQNYSYLNMFCEQCDSLFGYIVSTEENDIKTKCQQLNYVGNCQSVSSQIFLNTQGQSFPCVQCSDEQYLSNDDFNYVCKNRLKQDIEFSNCEQFSLNSENCLTCKSEFYLNKTETGCTPFPTGNFACLEYNNNLACKLCDQNFYLSEGVCTQIDSSYLITNCQYYSSQNTCQQCEDGYFLNENICEQQSTTIFCQIFESKDSCKSCPDDYKMIIINDKKSCVKVSKPSHCDIVDFETNKCKQCQKDYYVNINGLCSLKKIENCSQNQTDVICKRCEPNFILSLDGTKCIFNSDFFGCFEGVVSPTPICSICKGGYQFNNGVCVKNLNETIENGCFDQSEFQKCLFCISGWSMDNDGKCISNNYINMEGNKAFNNSI